MDGGTDSGGAGRQGVVIVIPSEPARVGRTLDTCWRGDKKAKAITLRYPAAQAAILAALALRLEYFSEIDLSCCSPAPSAGEKRESKENGGGSTPSTALPVVPAAVEQAANQRRSYSTNVQAERTEPSRLRVTQLG